MKQKSNYRLKLVLVGILATIVLVSGSAKADFVFGEPTNMGPTVNSPFPDTIDRFSADGLEMYISSGRSGGQGLWDQWVIYRKTVNDEWSTPVNLGYPINTSTWDGGGYISADGLELYSQSQRSGGYGGWDIWITRRVTKDSAWDEPLNLGPVINSSDWDGTP